MVAGCVEADEIADRFDVLLEIMELSEDETAAEKSRYANEVQQVLKRFKLHAKGVLGEVTLADVIGSQKNV